MIIRWRSKYRFQGQRESMGQTTKLVTAIPSHWMTTYMYARWTAPSNAFSSLNVSRMSYMWSVRFPSPRSLQHQVQVHNDLWDPIWLSDLDMWGLIALAEAWKKIECYNWKVALTSSCLSSCRALRCTCQSISKYTCRREVQNEK